MEEQTGKLRNYFEQVDWNQFDKAVGIEEKWREFMNIYIEDVRRFALKIRKQKVKKQRWFNKQYEEARKKRNLTWIKC